jgi:DNA polymerase II large subunit
LFSGISTDSEIAQWELPKDLKDLKQRVEEEEEETKRRIEAGEQPEGQVFPLRLILYHTDILISSVISKGSKIDRKTTLKRSRDTTQTALHLENVRHPPRCPTLTQSTTL